MNALAKLFPESAWISVSFEGWAGAIVVIRCGLVEGVKRYSGFTLKEAERRFRERFDLVGVRLRRVA